MAENLRPAISIRLYDEDNEYQEFTRFFIPWKLLKIAIKLSKQLEDKNLSELDEDTVDSLANLVVEVFGGQFTLEELNEKADVTEMITVIQTIVARASSTANPTEPS